MSISSTSHSSLIKPPGSIPVLGTRGALLAFLAMLLAGTASALDPSLAMSQYIRDRWGSEQGFPGGPVYAITQTPDGYLWFGVEEGLVRFDGLHFVAIRDISQKFTITSVLGLVADKTGDLWVRMEGPSLLRYRNGAFDRPSTLNLVEQVGITSMSLTNKGDVLISQMQQGAVAFRQGKSEVIADTADLPRTPILALAQTHDGNVWAGTRDAGLFRLAAGRTHAVTKGIPDLKVNCLLPDGEHALWVGTDSGIARWNGDQLTRVAIPAAQSDFQALAMVKDRDANLWVGTDSKGLLRLTLHGAYAFDGGGSGAAITAVFEDREGNLWIGSTSGIERLRDSAFVSYSAAEGVPANGNTPVFVDEENRVWFPPVEGGLWWLKDGQHGRVTAAGLDRDVVYSIAGRNGELWLGRRRGGLTRINPEHGGSGAKTYTRANGLAQDSVFAVHQTRDGAVWAGTLSGGVSRLLNGTFTTYTAADGLASNTVWSIFESSDGAMWFATPSGLSALTKGEWRTYTAKDGLPTENVNCLFEDSKGTLWVGTAGGLVYKSSRTFQVPAGLPASMRNQILGIAEDKQGSLWLSTSNHVLRVKRDSLLAGSLSVGDVREYGLADGLRGVEGVKRHRSVITDSMGRIWFSLNRGLAVVDPARIASAAIPVIVQVQGVTADGNAMNLNGPVRIPASPRRVTIAYAGLSLSVPERVQFRYTLDGFDHGWSEPIALREAAYTNLGPGFYRFRVIASNPDGVWNSSEAVLGFHVEPAYWQTWWFFVCATLAFLLAILAVYRLRLHQLTRQLSLRFEERIAERTRIAQELHDTLLQGFLSASMQLHVAVDTLPDDLPARPAFSRIIQLMTRVIDEGRNAVRGLRLSTDSSLEQAFSRFQQEIDVEDQAAFRVIVEGLPRSIHPVLRDEIYRIGREALINAFRHAKAKSIEVEIEYEPKRLRVLVRDDGRGIDPDVVKSGRAGHWGLRGMRERAERIGAQFHVYSSANGGTEVELSVPGHLAFQRQPSLGLLGRFFPWGHRDATPDGGKSLEGQ